MGFVISKHTANQFLLSPRVSPFEIATRLGAWRVLCDFLSGLSLNRCSVEDGRKVGLQICCLSGFTRSKNVGGVGRRRAHVHGRGAHAAYEHSAQARAPQTNGPRDVPRCEALSLLQKPLKFKGGSAEIVPSFCVCGPLPSCCPVIRARV